MWRLGVLGVILVLGARLLHSLLPSLGTGLTCGHLTRSFLLLYLSVRSFDQSAFASVLLVIYQAIYKTRAVASPRQNELRPSRICLDFARTFRIIITYTLQRPPPGPYVQIWDDCVQFCPRSYLIVSISTPSSPLQTLVFGRQVWLRLHFHPFPQITISSPLPGSWDCYDERRHQWPGTASALG